MVLTVAKITTLVVVAAGTALGVGVSPPSTNFIGTGPANINKNKGPPYYGGEYWPCQLTFTMTTDAITNGVPSATGGKVLSGQGSIGNNCEWVKINPYVPTTWSIKTYTSTGGTGVLHGLAVYVNQTLFCSGGTDMPFTWTNNGVGASTIDFQVAYIQPPYQGYDCNFSTRLTLSPDINVVQY